MARRFFLPLFFGLIGAAILLSLGTWQVRRMQWKEAILADIDSRIAAAPVAIPDAPDPERDRFLPVEVTGEFLPAHVDVLTSRKEIGAGYRVVQGFVTETGRRIMVDRGFLPQEMRGLPREALAAEITGNLHWPAEVDSFTPAPDPKSGLWFARDVPAMAKALETEPVLVVARSPTGDGIDPLPVDSAGIPNDHLGYAITWFSLAFGWVGMTLLFLWRIRRRT
ncbi:SURF1 family protein [Cereibacter changlensis JA139]|uniref:SURF1-like protein n=2 Tax=Cereibacter changlensis TaxID=402884 RepID=A0A2T4JVH7_9RHOB|nr:SURF1 family protein [Cereibacter changlensis]PTE21904.1 SURF1 family protein [Cereibacter changlensis JA139]PZX53545.1 surfeit locus 1 family protein [Cereibacter changlensis]